MQISPALAGYSLGRADLLRRAMGKKKPEVMAKQKGKFVDGAEKKGIDAEGRRRDLRAHAKFAGYGFNKSHSAAYGLRHVPDGVSEGATTRASSWRRC